MDGALPSCPHARLLAVPAPKRRQEVVQLLGRHWIIEDAGGAVVAEVPRGSKGVVGCTPLIKPGECFEYYR